MDNPKIVVVSTGRNCQQFLRDWYDSLTAQTYTNWTCHAVVDPSEDDSFVYLKTLAMISDKITWHRLNAIRRGCLYNTWQAVQAIEAPESIVVTLDLDDTLKPNALERVAQEYTQHPECWMTYGSYEVTDGRDAVFCSKISERVFNSGDHRAGPWKASHLRSFKAWLFQRIEQQSFRFDDGAWFTRATDRAFMYPMLEMCGSSKRARHIPDVLYTYRVYGQQKPESDVEQSCLRAIMQKPAYQRLETAVD